jgi:serine/threonine protein kinase
MVDMMIANHDELLCPITLALFRDPVVAQDGHTYERSAIEEWIRKKGTSPITSQQISIEHLYPNHAIKKAIDRFEDSLHDKRFLYTLDVDVKKKKGRPLFQTSGKTIYHAEWVPNNDGRPDIVLLKIDGARADKEASFYVDISRHPHIVRTFGFVRENIDRNSIMLLQECAREGSLHELVSERPTVLNEKVLIEMFLQIISAMSYLAFNNIVHGDLACRNVLVFHFDESNPRNNVVKVTDFGLSRHSRIYSQAPTAAKTALSIVPTRHCAPEILSPHVTANDYSEKSDVYSFGVLMWEAYSCGAIPWRDMENDRDVVKNVLNGIRLSQPPSCSPQYWSILNETWSKSPSQRPTFDQLKTSFTEKFFATVTSAPTSGTSFHHN